MGKFKICLDKTYGHYYTTAYKPYMTSTIISMITLSVTQQASWARLAGHSLQGDHFHDRPLSKPKFQEVRKGREISK